jgi:hypothetical protein
VGNSSWVALNNVPLSVIGDMAYHIPAPRSTSGAVVNLFKDSAERVEFEKALGLKDNDLSERSAYWDTFDVPVTYNGITLNLNDKFQLLQYKVLMQSKEVMKSKDDYESPMAAVMIHDTEAETAVVNVRGEQSAKAYNVLNTADTKTLRFILIALLVNNAVTMSDAQVRATIITIIERQNPKITVEAFITMSESKTLTYRALLQRACIANVITQAGRAFYIGEDIIGMDIDSTIAYLQDGKNAVLLTTIRERTKQYFSSLD